MSTAVIPSPITANADVNSAPLATNFSYLATFLNNETIHKDGSKAMTGELQLVDGNNAASVQQVADSLAALVPTGVVLEYSGASAPAGFLLAQGQEVSRATYADLNTLYSAMGYPYGNGNGTTTFNVPNRKGKVGVGVDSADTLFDTVGETGGSKDAVNVAHDHPMPHTHSTPAHSHNLKIASTATGTGGIAPGSGAPSDLSTGANGAGDTGGGTTGAVSTANTTSAGVSGTNKNVQPYIALNYIVKT